MTNITSAEFGCLVKASFSATAASVAEGTLFVSRVNGFSARTLMDKNGF